MASPAGGASVQASRRAGLPVGLDRGEPPASDEAESATAPEVLAGTLADICPRRSPRGTATTAQARAHAAPPGAILNSPTRPALPRSHRQNPGVRSRPHPP